MRSTNWLRDSAYVALALVVAGLAVFGPSTAGGLWQLQVALQVLMGTIGVIVAVRALFRRDAAFVLIGLGVAVSGVDLEARWPTWAGLVLILAGAFMRSRKKFENGSAR